MLRSIASFCYRITRALWAYLLGKPINLIRLNYGTVGSDDVRIARKFLYNRQLDQDQVVEAFEKEFSQVTGCRYSYSFLKGRVALSACLHALDLKPGDQVLIPAFTCLAVANACWVLDLQLRFCDIELDSFGLCFESFSDRLEKHPGIKAVIIQHTFGLVCRDFDKLLDACRKEGISIIEDCCHATGASYRGKKLGNFGDLAYYSSERSKVFSTYQGGIAVTNDDELAIKLRNYQASMNYPSRRLTKAYLRSYIWGYYNLGHPYRKITGPISNLFLARSTRRYLTAKESIQREPPTNYFLRMPGPLAAIGLNQLKKLDDHISIRRLTSKRWFTWCQENELQAPTVIPESEPVFLRFPVLTDRSRKEDRAWAALLGVEVGVWFKSYLHPVDFHLFNCPNAEKAIRCCINFPTLE